MAAAAFAVLLDVVDARVNVALHLRSRIVLAAGERILDGLIVFWHFHVVNFLEESFTLMRAIELHEGGVTVVNQMLACFHDADGAVR